MDPVNSSARYASGPSGVFKTVSGAEVQSEPTISAVLNGASYLAGPCFRLHRMLLGYSLWTPVARGKRL
jgi:hypothetical protein